VGHCTKKQSLVDRRLVVNVFLFLSFGSNIENIGTAAVGDGNKQITTLTAEFLSKV